MTAGGRVRLRGWRESDVPALLEMRNDVPLQALLLARARGSDAARVREWITARNSGNSVVLVVADAADDRAIGYVQAQDIDREDGRADVGICLSPAAQGRGLGTEALRGFMRHLAETEGIGKVTLRVRSDNGRAIRCYRALGFRECGTMRSHSRFDGRWLDVTLMEAFMDATRGAGSGRAAHA
jgi:diamine N-acetyltransferase